MQWFTEKMSSKLNMKFREVQYPSITNNAVPVTESVVIVTQAGQMYYSYN